MHVEERASRGTLSVYTARQIMRDVMQRGLRVGESLGDESWLIENYDVARGTLREALKLLSFLGAITVKSGPRGGPQLTTPGSAVVGSALGMVIQFRGATLHTVFEARTAIEPSAAALAADRRNETDLKQLRKQLDLLRVAESVHGPAYAAHSERFNVVLAEGSHNDVLSTLVPALAAMTATVQWRYTRGMRPELTERIGTVVEAIADRDTATASTAHSDMWHWVMSELLAT
ncbi:MAG TPA: FCD domain-containing protein, partial [Jatrophihabitans sp.]|nr:FCD domain-containing protein [Jatrophihabitans sp.]